MQSGCNLGKWLYSGNVVVFREKAVLLRQSGCIRGKLVVFGENRLYSAKWLYSGKVVVFGQSGSVRAKWLYSGKNGCIQAKMVVFG